MRHYTLCRLAILMQTALCLLLPMSGRGEETFDGVFRLAEIIIHGSDKSPYVKFIGINPTSVSLTVSGNLRTDRNLLVPNTSALQWEFLEGSTWKMISKLMGSFTGGEEKIVWGPGKEFEFCAPLFNIDRRFYSIPLVTRCKLRIRKPKGDLIFVSEDLLIESLDPFTIVRKNRL